MMSRILTSLTFFNAYCYDRRSIRNHGISYSSKVLRHILLKSSTLCLHLEFVTKWHIDLAQSILILAANQHLRNLYPLLRPPPTMRLIATTFASFFLPGQFSHWLSMPPSPLPHFFYKHRCGVSILHSPHECFFLSAHGGAPLHLCFIKRPGLAPRNRSHRLDLFFFFSFLFVLFILFVLFVLFVWRPKMAHIVTRTLVFRYSTHTWLGDAAD